MRGRAEAALLGIDVGTSSAKAVLVDAHGRLLAAAGQDHPTYSPARGYQEQQAEDWWAGVCAATRRLLAETNLDPASIAGISLSGQGCACLPVDRQGRPLSRAFIWTDTRAMAEQARIRQIFGPELGRVTGNDIYDQPEPRMLWLQRHEPDTYRQTWQFLTTVSYLALQLTGEPAASVSDWGFHLAFDRLARGWNETFLAEVGLDSARFPPLYAPYDVVGGVTPQAAAETGLLPGTPVVAGGQDSTVSALAVGALTAGQSLNMRGTTDLLSACTDSPDYHPDLYTTCAVPPGLYMSFDMKEVVAAGGSYRWLAAMLFGRAGETEFFMMNDLAAQAPPGCNGLLYLPYLLMATNPDPARQRSGSFFGLTITTGRSDLCRAVMEGTAFALREAAERMAGAGISVTELLASGGPTKSRLWNQITADVTGLPVLLPAASAGAAYGAALLAGLGVGLFSMADDFHSLRRAVRLKDRFEPRPEARPTYERMYATFRQLAQETAGISAGQLLPPGGETPAMKE